MWLYVLMWEITKTITLISCVSCGVICYNDYYGYDYRDDYSVHIHKTS